MKIAVVHNLPSGGGKRALHEFCRRLSQQGHVLDVYVPALANENFLPLAPEVRRVFSFPIQRFRLWQTRFLPFVIQYLNLPRRIVYLRALEHLYGRMAETIANNDYDLAFVHHCQVVQSPYILRHLRIPGVYYCQEPPRRLYEPELVRRTTLTWKQKIQRAWYAPAATLYQAIEKYADARNARAASLMLVNSYFSRESVYRVYGSNARVNYLGIDTERFRPSVREEKHHQVIAVGRTYPEKGYDFLVQALAGLPQTIRPQLLIVADMRDPAEECYFLKIAERHGVDVAILSNISDDALVRAYQQSKMCVYAPILEPFGFTPLEAMACGLPVVAVQEGGIRETVVDGETGFLTQRDPHEFAEKMRVLLEHPEVAARYGQNARQHVAQHWTWDRSVQELVRNFQHLQQV